MGSVPGFETGNTVQFTFVSSVQPDAAPLFSVADQAGSVVASVTAISSDATHYYALYTMPNSHGQYQVATWLAQKTVSGSAYNFIKRQGFLVTETMVEV